MQFESNVLHKQAKEESEFEFENFNRAASSSNVLTMKGLRDDIKIRREFKNFQQN
jgi:hypothetical protein